MTWKEFKDAAESRGIRDDSDIWYIDLGNGFERVDVHQDPTLGWTISD